jgi:hypothetical protein
MPKFTPKQKAEILAQARTYVAQHEASKRQQVQPVRNNAAERCERPQREVAAPRFREPSDLDSVLGNGKAREFYHEVMAEVIYELQREFDHKLKEQAEQIRTVELQLAEMRGGVRAAEYRSAIRELRHQVNADQAIDLPNLQQRGLN